ncbi:MAG: porin [Gemmataceae bacterium]
MLLSLGLLAGLSGTITAQEAVPKIPLPLPVQTTEAKNLPGDQTSIASPAKSSIENANVPTVKKDPGIPTPTLLPVHHYEPLAESKVVTVIPAPEGPSPHPFTASYKYNGFGGFTSLESDNFTLAFQNQITLDGTFHNFANPPTIEQGFNIPFLRSYVYGNILQDWEYLISTQFFINTFGILDMYGGYKINDSFNIRAGHFLSPFLYEYYAFSPAWEPVITNSPLFQLAGKRQTGIMAWGQLFEKHVQYQAGVFNGPNGAYFDLDNFVDFIGSIAYVPFKGLGPDSIWNSLGFGVSMQTGKQRYNLAAGVPGAEFGNGEPTTNSNFIGSTGIPFFAYNPNVNADGMRTKVAPQFFWLGQFSLMAEYVFWNRTLSDPTHSRVIEVLNGWEATASYFLTGEKYSGDGLGGFTTIVPNSPFIPSKGMYGTGAWELTAQYSQLQIDGNVVDLGMVQQGVSATRLNQLMVGMNWWPNRYTRISLDWMNAKTNQAVDMGNGNYKDGYSVYWGRLAMFF